MKKFLSASVLILFGTAVVYGQQQKDPGTTQSLEQRFKLQFETDRTLAEKIAQEKHISLRRVDRAGRLLEFSRFDERGNMLFNITDNVGAGRSTSTNKVWPGGIVGTSLTGVLSGNRLGEWDGGAVLTTHQEYAGRVTQVDAPASTHFHATHVAGTMIASGISANAKGMAYQASLRAYDWNNDASEMSAAASAGMLLSNHSYGTITGWYLDGSKYVWWGDSSVSKVEDYKFGYYDWTSSNWDNIAYNNQNYLICKSAGNDRGDNLSGTVWEYSDGTPGAGTPPPADGQYDCISTYSGAKNVLTVGAVNKIANSNTNDGWTKVSDVVMSSFSGWGPMDDGRIKPDVVGCGVNLFSTLNDSNNAYGTLSGTSMATPNVCGSLVLVQQHYNNLKGSNKFMKAATLKGLVIHTADEAGNVGPDYKFGWGLVNTAKAVQFITDSVSNQMQERSLANLATYTQTVSSSGASPMRITISWTDPAGTPITPTLDAPNKMLVNDLDIKLVRNSDNAIFYPYILNKDTPAALATTGINSVDNVEQIYLATPQAGNYTLTVSHKGTLAAAQNYSLLFSGLMGQPSASLQASSRSLCTGQKVIYQDVSSGSPTSRTWYFPGGTPSTSTKLIDTITYSTAGKYAVSLVVANGLGKDSVYLVNYITVGGLTLPFVEDFENTSTTLSSWTINNPNNDTTWRLANIGGTAPGNRAYCMPFFNYSAQGRRDGLITPTLSFKGYSSVNLSFSHAYARDPLRPADSLVVWISTNCGSAWTRLLSKGEDNSGNFRTAPDNPNEFTPALASDWCFGPNNNCININLNAYANLNNIKIKFEGYNMYNNNLYIDNVNITGTPLLPVANFYSSKKKACVGEPVQFYDSTVNIATSWKWTFTGGTPSTSTLPNPTNIVYNTPGTYTVKLVSTNSAGSDSITKANYITINVIPGKPNVSHLRPLDFCDGDSTILTSDSAANLYQWMLNSGNFQQGQQITVYSGGYYKVRTTNGNGCSNTSDSALVTRSAFPAQPTFTSSITGDFMCTGGTADFSSSALSGNQWYKNGVAIPGATSKTFSTQDSGVFSVQVTNGVCSSPMSASKTIGLLPSPVTSVITGADSSKVNLTENYSVTNTPGSIYTWTITGGSKTSGGTTSAIQVKWNNAGSGSVKVQESGNNGCKGALQTFSVYVKDNIGLPEEKLIYHLDVYPNPASHEVTLSFVSQVQAPAKMVMMNVLGQSVKELNADIVKGINNKKIDLTDMDRGIYFIEIQSGEGKAVQRLIIQ